MIGLFFLRYFEGVADCLWLSTWGFVCLFVMCIGRQMLLNGLQIWFAWWDYLSKNRSVLCWDFVNALWTALMTVGLEIVSKDEEFPPSGVTAACCRCLRLQWCPLLAAPLPLSKGWESNSNVYWSKLPLRLMLWPCLNGATFVLFVPFTYKVSIALFEPICTVIFCKLCYAFLRPVDSNLVKFRSLRVRISRQFLLRIILIMGEWVLLFFCWQGSSLLCFWWCFLSWFDCCWFFVDCGIIEALRTATAIRCRSLFFLNWRLSVWSCVWISGLCGYLLGICLVPTFLLFGGTLVLSLVLTLLIYTLDAISSSPLWDQQFGLRVVFVLRVLFPFFL